jgi:hypothetical protein
MSRRVKEPNFANKLEMKHDATGNYVDVNGQRHYYLDIAINPDLTVTAAPIGSIAQTSNATGRGQFFASDGSKWQGITGGDGGGIPSNDLIQTIEKTFTNDDILNLTGASGIILPATSSPNYVGTVTELFIPVSGFCIVDTRAGVYTNADDARFQIAISTNFDYPASALTDILRELFVNPAVSLVHFTFPNLLMGAVFGETANTPTSAVQKLTGGLKDNAVQLFVFNASEGTDLVGGHADNTLKVVLNYHTIALG